MIFPLSRKLILGGISSKLKKKRSDEKKFIDGEFEDIEDDHDRKL